jgi:hypothetical protein
MGPSLQQYLKDRSFVEVPVSEGLVSGLAVQAYENGQFRLHIVNERSLETYAQVAPIGMPAERWFLSGVVAFLTNDDSATRMSGQYAAWLVEHHEALARFFSPTPDGHQQRARYVNWQQDFATRELARFAEAAAVHRAKAKAWWRFW